MKFCFELYFRNCSTLIIPHEYDDVFFEHIMLKQLGNIFLVHIFFAIDTFVRIFLTTLLTWMS